MATEPDELRQSLYAQVRAAHRRKALTSVGLPCGQVAIDGKAHHGPNNNAADWGHNPLPWPDEGCLRDIDTPADLDGLPGAGGGPGRPRRPRPRREPQELRRGRSGPRRPISGRGAAARGRRWW